MSFQSNTENVTSTDVQLTTINNENVQVSSLISHDSTNQVALNVYSGKLSELMDRLSTTHALLDNYAQQRTHRISIETQHIIEHILEETKQKQRQLLFEAQTKSEQFQEEYQNNLEMKVNQLNQEKAEQLVQLEQALNQQQESILNNARQQIDSVQQYANQVGFYLTFSFSYIFVFFSVK
jgi:vacuolar-type H+-ATPase subunit H